MLPRLLIAVILSAGLSVSHDVTGCESAAAECSVATTLLQGHVDTQGLSMRAGADHGIEASDIHVVVINLNRSVERWRTLNAHLQKLNVSVARFPAVELKFNENGQEFFPEDRPKLKKAFGHWSCGNWPCLDKNDFQCCIGMKGVMHYSTSFNDQGKEVSGIQNTKRLGNFVSHQLVFNEIQKNYTHGEEKLVLVAEDDIRLRSRSWRAKLQTAINLAHDWDIIKLYGNPCFEPDCEDPCAMPKVCAADGQCIVKINYLCQYWVTNALVMNPKKISKINLALEATWKNYTSYCMADVIKRSDNGEVVDADNSTYLKRPECITRVSIDVMLMMSAGHGRINMYGTQPWVAKADEKLGNKSTFES